MRRSFGKYFTRFMISFGCSQKQRGLGVEELWGGARSWRGAYDAAPSGSFMGDWARSKTVLMKTYCELFVTNDDRYYWLETSERYQKTEILPNSAVTAPLKDFPTAIFFISM